MSTAATIGVKYGGNVIYTRCNYDGYIDGVGAELLRKYNSTDSALELIEVGEIRSLNGGVEYYKDNAGYPLETAYSAFAAGNMKEFIASSYIYLYANGEWRVRKPRTEWVLLVDAVRDPSLLK